MIRKPLSVKAWIIVACAPVGLWVWGTLLWNDWERNGQSTRICESLWQSRHVVFGMTVGGGGEDLAINMAEDVFYGGRDLDGAQMGEEETIFNQVSWDRLENAHTCSVTSNSQDGWEKTSRVTGP